MTTPSMMRRTYDAVAMFAVLNLAAMLGFVGYLIASKTITGPRLRAMVEYVHNAETPPGEDGTEASDQPAAEPAAAQAAPNPQPVGLTAEIMRREAERIKAELDQRLALNNSILLRITKEREAFEREQALEAARREQAKEERETVGFSKQVAIFEALASKVAIKHLLSMPDQEDAAGMLLAIDTRKAKKIIEAAKTPDEMRRMQLILQTLRDLAPAKSKQLASEQ
ncbi:MAG: hypothetical protein ACE5E5_03755 [Phycisphaerae bacterium]